MPIASLYGYDTAENFNYCMNASFNSQAKEHLGPVYQLFGGFVGVLGTLVETSQKVKLAFATMFGGIQTIMQEFTERLKIFFIRIEVMAQRMKMMMYRIYASMFAVIFMATSGLTAVKNFGGTLLFDVIDTFCFAPETEIYVEGRGVIEIRDVQLGDVLCNGESVLSVFRFLADGQAMVRFDGGSNSSSKPIIVSTNHYVAHDGRWIRADQHPAAEPVAPWAGGCARPLICLNTTSNCIPMGHGLVFRDYDETATAHADVMRDVHLRLNGGASASSYKSRYGDTWTELYPSVDPTAIVKLWNGTRRACDVKLGSRAADGSIIVGRIRHQVREICALPYGEYVGAGTLVYMEGTQEWLRAGNMWQVIKLAKPIVFESFITLPGSIIELTSGYKLRDYLEIPEQAMEERYAAALAEMEAPAPAPVDGIEGNK